jgi:predicted HTH transcriptional regulator
VVEHAALELKAHLDLGVNADKMKLVSEIVAMANADGGLIRVGVADDGTEVGLAPDLVAKFDPARLADLVGSFTNPDHVEVTISIVGGGGSQIVDLAVECFADPPLVICKDGNYEDGGRQTAEFRKGDVLVRRGTRAQRATRSDFAAWTRQACENARRTLLDRVAFVADLPEGAERVCRGFG